MAEKCNVSKKYKHKAVTCSDTRMSIFGVVPGNLHYQFFQLLILLQINFI